MEKIKIALQYCIAQRSFSRFLGWLASLQADVFTTAVINWFIKKYKVNMEEALHSDPRQFNTFNEFFTRKLKPSIRPITQDINSIVFPADGTISQLGHIEEGRIIQAKGHLFSVQDLLGGDSSLAEKFHEGNYATTYLSPGDYHRVHMPCDGTLRKVIYVPGDLFSVNPLTAKHVPNLFARNERVICIFDTDFGIMAQILIGAIIVGSIELAWTENIIPTHGHKLRSWNYPTDGNPAIKLIKGEEMGKFKFGSTVINLFTKDSIFFNDSIQTNAIARFGSPFATKYQKYIDN